MAGVKIDVAADTTKLQTGLNQAQQSVSKFSGRLESLQGVAANVEARFQKMGAGIAGGFQKIQGAWLGVLAAFGAFAGIKGLAEEVGRVSDLANRFGTTVETIQKLGQAAEIGGSDLESITKALFKAQLAATDAAGGNEKLGQAFADLGVSVEDFMGVPLEDKLKALADGYGNSENKAKANAAALDILGKAGMDLIPVLAMGADGIEQAMDMTNQFSTDTAEAMGEVEDRWNAAFLNIKIFTVETIGVIIDAIDKLSISIAASLNHARELFKDFKITDHPLQSIQKIMANRGDAKKVYNSTVDAGINDHLDKQEARKTKTNKVSSANITRIRAEYEADKEGQGGKDSKGEESLADKNAQAKNLARLGFAERIKAAREQVKAEEKARREEEAKAKKQNKLKSAEQILDKQENVLSSLESRQGNVNFDSLQRIGGGYANSTNAIGAGKQETLLQKQIDAQREMVDQQKKTVEAIKNVGKTSSSTDGITS